MNRMLLIYCSSLIINRSHGCIKQNTVIDKFLIEFFICILQNFNQNSMLVLSTLRFLCFERKMFPSEMRDRTIASTQKLHPTHVEHTIYDIDRYLGVSLSCATYIFLYGQNV